MQEYQQPDLSQLPDEMQEFLKNRLPTPSPASLDMARLEARIRGITEGLTLALEILKQGNG